MELDEFDFADVPTNLQRSEAVHRGSFAGSHFYMSVEMMLGNSSGPHNDLWSLGVLTYQLLTGNLPFENDLECQCQVLSSKYQTEGVMFPKNVEIDEDAKDFIQRLMRANPADRLGFK